MAENSIVVQIIDLFLPWCGLLMRLALYFYIFLALNSAGFAEICCPSGKEDLMRDLITVEEIDQRLNERYPVLYNHLLQGGYISMPSSRMGNAGEIGLGYASVPPYRLWNLRCQLLDRLEISGNYRIFKGVDDPVLTPYGFGDFADKGANVKLALILPEESDYRLPGFAIGLEDFIGTRAFKSGYFVLTKVFLEQEMEISIGYGKKRIRGWFGGLQWMPFRQSKYQWLQNLALIAEYDATPYTDCGIEPHPKGRDKRSPINAGLKYRLWDGIDCSLSYIRGDKWAFSISGYYNFGSSDGLLPKLDDPFPYRAPVNIEPLGPLRPEVVLVQDLVYAFRAQGFEILESWLSFNLQREKVLRLRVANNIYRYESDVRERLNHLVAFLMPSNLAEVIITIDSEGLLIQEYHFMMPFVRAYAAKEIGDYELMVLTPLTEATFPDALTDWRLFKRKPEIFCPELLPKTYGYFGSSTGKFKYAIGAQALLTGYLSESLYYSAILGYLPWQNLSSLNDFDRLNPSQLINVRTDIVRYLKQKGVTLDEAYLQKTWNLSTSLYGRMTAGYLEVEYGGVAGELLYYPVNSSWAIGIDGAIVKKRKVNSWFGFENKIRKLKHFHPTYQNFLGSQFFVNAYWEWMQAKMDFRVKLGKFLANDWGARFEVSRYFPSGLRVTMWYTCTNGHDKVNGQTYYDKGIAFTMPLDIFYTRCDRDVWGYGMSAWLRDVGVTAYTGQELYYMINDQR